MRGVARYCEPFVEYSPREQQSRSPRKFTTVLCRTSIRLRGERSTASPVSSGSKSQHFATNSSQGGGHESDATITFSWRRFTGPDGLPTSRPFPPLTDGRFHLEARAFGPEPNALPKLCNCL